MLLAADSLFLFASCNNSSCNAYQIIKKKYYFRLVVFWCYIFSLSFFLFTIKFLPFSAHTLLQLCCVYDLYYLYVCPCVLQYAMHFCITGAVVKKKQFFESLVWFFGKKKLVTFYMYVLCILTYKYFFMMCCVMFMMT